VTESPASEKPLLQLVVKQKCSPETLAEIRERTAASVASLPRETMNLDNPVLVPVEISAALGELIEQTQARNEPHRR